MAIRKTRVIILIASALIITVVLTFAFSPAVRAGMETILTFNGVTVRVDEATGKLVVTGNMDAVVEQSDFAVEIHGENGEYAGAGIAPAQAVESVNASDLLSSHPELILPAVPAGYSLQPEIELAGDGMTITWQNSNGHLIIYQRSPASFRDGIPGSQESNSERSTTSDGQSTLIITSGSGFISMDGNYKYSGPMLTYNWENYGCYHELVITDISMSDVDIQAMLP